MTTLNEILFVLTLGAQLMQMLCARHSAAHPPAHAQQATTYEKRDCPKTAFAC